MNKSELLQRYDSKNGYLGRILTCIISLTIPVLLIAFMFFKHLVLPLSIFFIVILLIQFVRTLFIIRSIYKEQH